MPGRVPERWEEYSPYKYPVKGTRFLAFKVPLEQSICFRLPKEKWLRPNDLLELLDKDNYKLGLIIDLTNTARYYKPEEIESHDVKYVKINTEGRLVPSKEVQERFARIVDDFLESNIDNDLLIGVHCTHGLNRTGYMVCRYMIDRMKFDPQQAIDAFNEARGYDIERDNYLTDLLNSNKDPEDRVVVDNASDGEIIEDEDEDCDSEPDEPVTPVKPDPVVDKPTTLPTPADRTQPPFTSPDSQTFGQHSNLQGNFQNDFRGRGFQRRPHGNRGFQNNYNRGGVGGGGFGQNFDNRRGYRARNRGGGGNFRGNFRGGWKDQGYQKLPYYDYDDEDDLDDDTEVIITATERGTIIREERSISEHRRKLAETQGRGGRTAASLKRGHDDHRDGDGDATYKTARLARDRLGHTAFDADWRPDEGSRGRKHWMGGGDAFSEREPYRTGPWKGRSPFEAEGVGKGRGGSFEGSSHGRGKTSFDGTAGGRGKGLPYQESNEWTYKGKGYHNDHFPKKSKYYDDDDDTTDTYFKKYSQGFAASERSRRSWSPDVPKAYRDESKESRFRDRGQQEAFRSRADDDYKGLGDGRRGGYMGRGRGRDMSPPLPEREQSPVAYRSRPRGGNYGEDDPEPSSYHPADDPSAFSRFRDDNSSEFFGKKPRSAFQNEGPSTFRKKIRPAAFQDDSPEFDGDTERDLGGKKTASCDESFRKPKYRGRNVRDSFGRDRFDDSDSDDGSLSTSRRRRLTPPAQYRDPEPDDNEDSPPFCDESPPFTGSDDGFRARDSIFGRGRDRDEAFASRGRAYARGAF